MGAEAQEEGVARDTLSHFPLALSVKLKEIAQQPLSFQCLLGGQLAFQAGGKHQLFKH